MELNLSHADLTDAIKEHLTKAGINFDGREISEMRFKRGRTQVGTTAAITIATIEPPIAKENCTSNTIEKAVEKQEEPVTDADIDKLLDDEPCGGYIEEESPPITLLSEDLEKEIDTEVDDIFSEEDDS